MEPFYDETGSGIRIVTTFDNVSCWASSRGACREEDAFGCWVDQSTPVNGSAIAARAECLSQLSVRLGDDCIPSARRCNQQGLGVCGSDGQWVAIAECMHACNDGHCANISEDDGNEE